MMSKLVKIESNSKNSYIKEIKSVTTQRKKDIKRWIENENVLCGLDCNYWSSRYAWVCNPPEAPIWMADYTFKPIGEIHPGDEIIGWKLNPLLSNKKHPERKTDSRGRKKKQVREHLCKTKVISVNRRISHIVKVTMESGAVIRCTPDHLWSSGEHDRGRIPWIPARIGKHLRKVVDVYPNNPPDLREAAWLGGMYDGEGSTSTIAQDKNHNPDVHARLIEAMKMFEFKQRFGSGEMGKNGDYAGYDDHTVRINGELTGKAKFAAWCKPTRIKSLEKAILQTIRAYRDKIIDIQYDGEGEVVSMQTETGNYVAWGYASKNCDEKGQIFKYQPRMSQKVLDAVIADFDEKQVSIELIVLKGRQLGVTSWTALKFLHRMLFLPHTQAIMASVKSEASQLISRIIDTAYNRCPFWLVPLRMPKRSFSNGSVLSIQSGMQATGLAQGWTPSAVHVCLESTTYIHTQDGKMKQIKDIVPGDLVITSKGVQAPVKIAVKSLRENEVACELSLWGNYDPLVVTRDHKILTTDGFTPAECIGKHDYVVMPVRQIDDKIKSVDIFHNQGRKNENKPAKKETIKLTRKWGWLCGLYIAEGSAHRNVRLEGKHWDSIYFTIHQDEVADYKNGLQDALGMFQSIRVDNMKKSKTANLVVQNSGMARWLVQNFGHLADGKTIPDWVFSAGQEFVLGLLHGYLDGDGHMPEGNASITASSISSQLIIQLRDLLASSGFGWSCIYHDHAGFRYGRNCKDRWQLRLNGDYARKLRVAMGWNAVEKIQKTYRLDHVNCSSAPKHWMYSVDGKNILIEVFENRAVGGMEFYDLEVDAAEHDFCTIHCCVKNSEIGDVPDPQKTIEEGLFRATHSSKNLFMVLEGTGGGNTGWLADTWRAAKDDWPKGKSRLCPIFISWPMCPEIYPQPDWIRKFPVPEGFYYKRKEATKKHVARCESYIRNTSYLAKMAGSNYKMPLEQQWYWEFNYDAACKNHTQKTWMAQIPADDFEALTGKHDPIFDLEVIQEVEETVYHITTIPETGQDIKTRKKPLQAYAIQGDSIDDAFILDKDDPTIDWDQPVIPVTFKNHRNERYNWELIPLLPINEDVETETFDKLLVYEPPVDGADYSCGVDTADGLNQPDEERACASINRNMFGKESDRQCAELTSKRMNPAQMTAFVACMAAWYGQKTKDWRGVKFAIEQIRGPGDTCQNQLKIMGFNFHHKPKRYDSKKVKDESKSKEGWYSNVWSVPILMTSFVEAVNGGWYRPASKWLIEELKTLERHTTAGKSKMEHRAGQFDDRVRAAATAYFTFHDLDDLAQRSQKRNAPPEKKRVSPESGRCRANAVSVGGWE